MNNYLVNRGVLEQFIDELMKRKPLPLNGAEEIKNFREESIASLDKEIGMAIFGKLNDAQLREFDQLLDSNNESPETFKRFFEESGVDLQKTVNDTLIAFKERFLGGKNE